MPHAGDGGMAFGARMPQLWKKEKDGTKVGKAFSPYRGQRSDQTLPRCYSSPSHLRQLNSQDELWL